MELRVANGWSRLALSKLLDFSNGVNADKTAYGSGIPFANVLEVITNTHLKAKDIPGKIVLSTTTAASFAVRYGDVLFNRTSETQEEVGLASVYVDQEPVVFGGFVIRGRPIGNVLDPQYVGYGLRSPDVRTQIIARGQGGIRSNIGQADLRTVEVLLPPIEEQRAIAAALGDVDALIGTLDKLIAKKRDLKQAAMQQLLKGHTRLPGFHGEWEERSLYQVIEGLDAGVSVRSVDEDEGTNDCFVLKTSAVSGGLFLANERKPINPADTSRAKCEPKRDTILISRMNTPDLVGEVGYVEQDYVNHYLPDRLWAARFRTGGGVFVRWLGYILSSPSYKQKLKAMATGTSGSMKNISKPSFLSLVVNFPGYEEQCAIATTLSDMDAELAALQARRDKTRALKQGMMQELLMGRIRLV